MGILLVLGTLLIGGLEWRVAYLDQRQRSPRLGIANAGALDLRDLDGRPVKLSLRGPRPTLIHLWASWCAPCVQELPIFAAAAPLLKERGVDLVLVAQDDPADARRALEQSRIEASTLLADDAAAQELFALSGSVGALPVTVGFDEDGHNPVQRVGAVDGGVATVLGWADRLIRKKPTTAGGH
jgi:thiol-disulfide isomerase/thioredoxin